MIAPSENTNPLASTTLPVHCSTLTFTLSRLFPSSFFTFFTYPKIIFFDKFFYLSKMSESPEDVAGATQVTLKVTLPKCVTAADVLEIPFTSEQSIGDLHQTLALLPIARNLTLYYVEIEGQRIDDPETTIGMVLDAVPETSELQVLVKEKPYTMAGVYEQICKFRELIGLHYLDRVAGDLAAQSGVNKINTLGLTPVEEGEEDKKEAKADDKDDKKDKEPKKEPKKLSDEESAGVAALELALSTVPSLKDSAQFANFMDAIKVPIRGLTVSQWSPVPAHRRATGDLLYLTITTLELEIFHVTAHVLGFFVNQLTSSFFKPEPQAGGARQFLLYNLLLQLSPGFDAAVEQFEVLVTQLAADLPELFLLATLAFLALPWIVDPKATPVAPDVSRSQLAMLANGVDGADYVKDWNDEVQLIRELPAELLDQRIIRDKLLQKLLHEFAVTATKEAVLIVEGSVTAMNPLDPEDAHIFLKNGVFYSLGQVDVDNYPETGGAEAARYLWAKDLAAGKVASKFSGLVAGDDIHTVATTLVDYMGKRIVCQTPVPGIFATGPETPAEEVEKVVYGLPPDKQTVAADKRYAEPFAKLAETFHLKPHKVQDTELVVSQDFKGIDGTDGRKYVMDLYRLTPRDIEFIEKNWDGSETSYPHAEAVLRHEAVDTWWRRQVLAYIKDQEKPELPKGLFTLNPDAFAPGVDASDEDKQQVREVSQFVTTLIGEWIALLPSQLAPFDGANLAENLHKHGINLRYLGEIARRCLAEVDTIEAKEKDTVAAHEKKADELAAAQQAKFEAAREKAKAEQAKKEEALKNGTAYEPPAPEEEEKEPEAKLEDTAATFATPVANYRVAYRLAVQEMVARAVKHLLRAHGALVPRYVYAAFVAHFHNCLLGGDILKLPEIVFDETTELMFPEATALEFVGLTHAQVHDQVKKEVFKRFRFELPADWLELVPKQVLLREIALKVGIQWHSRDYAFTAEALEAANEAEKPAPSTIIPDPVYTKKGRKGKKKPAQPIPQAPVKPRTTAFVAKDIVAFVPVVKDSGYKSTIIEEIYALARAHVAEGDRDTGVAILNDLIAIEEQIYTRISPETARFYLNMAQTFGELGSARARAAALARKAVVVAERTLGFDSYEVIRAYINAAYLELETNAPNLMANALKLYLQAIATVEGVYGSARHPAVVTALSSLGEALALSYAGSALTKVFETCLDLSKAVHGELSEFTGLMYYKLANAVVARDETKFAEGQSYFAKAAEIFTKLVGPEDPLARETATYATNIAAYLKYQEMQVAQQRAQATAGKDGKVKIKLVDQLKNQGKPVKKHLKKSPPQADPTIALQSVDDILAYINGTSSLKKKKAKK